MARRTDQEHAAILDRFVTVRVVQMWGVDLARFQFDWELTWAAVFLNADGTVYGRYGSRRSRESLDDDSTIGGFLKAAEGALEIHAGYPGNAHELAGKQAVKPKWPTPEAIPALKGRPGIRPATGERAACVHCHQVQEGELWSMRAAKEEIPDRLLWAHPDPEKLGFSLDPHQRATVSEVKASSFQKGDRILKLGGQPIVSIADVQWVLHHAEDKPLEAEVDRAGQRVKLSLMLPDGWRRRDDYAWRSIAWSLRHRLAGTGVLEPQAPLPRMPPGGGMKESGMSLVIKKLPPDWVRDRNLSAAAELRDGDVIVAVDGRKDLHREEDFLAYLLQKKAPGSVVELSVLRKGKPVQAFVRLP